jgi:DNA polymerase I-like protein with 3'-5' exonuclease and polymerase domains
LAGANKVVMPVIKVETDGDGESDTNKKGKKLSAGKQEKKEKIDESGQQSLTASLPLPIDTADLEKTALALWLVDSNKTNPTIDDIRAFANSDNYEDAKKAIYAEMERRNVKKVYDDIELPLIPVLHKMEKRGVKVNRKVLADLAKSYHAEVNKLEKQIWKESGVEFNISSPKQLGEILFDKLAIKIKNQKKTAGGARSTRESELEKMRDLHPIVPMIFEYRELSKLLSTYIDAIPPLLDDNDRVSYPFCADRFSNRPHGFDQSEYAKYSYQIRSRPRYPSRFHCRKRFQTSFARLFTNRTSHCRFLVR